LHQPQPLHRAQTTVTEQLQTVRSSENTADAIYAAQTRHDLKKAGAGDGYATLRSLHPSSLFKQQLALTTACEKLIIFYWDEQFIATRLSHSALLDVAQNTKQTKTCLQ
jgi:hypothetical protein